MPRTIVNRIWARLFGRGLVEDVDDMDGEPWSPELLDWLSADFVEHGYDLKHLLSTIMTSQAYQLPAVHRAEKAGEGLRVSRSGSAPHDCRAVRRQLERTYGRVAGVRARLRKVFMLGSGACRRAC